MAGELKRMGLAAKAEQGGARFEPVGPGLSRQPVAAGRGPGAAGAGGKGGVQLRGFIPAGVLHPWEAYLPKDGLSVTGKCVRNRLMSVRDCQAVSKRPSATGCKPTTGWSAFRKPARPIH